MARKPQQLINYHSSGITSMPAIADVQFGEIVVRHAADKPELLIKVKSGETEYFVTFIASGAVHTAINKVTSNVEEQITNLTHYVDAVSGTVTADYALSAATHNEITAATQDAKDYADTQDDALSGRIVTYVKGTVENNLDGLAGRLDAVEGDITELQTFSGIVESQYATKEFVGAASGYAYNQAKTDLIGGEGDTSASTTITGAKKYTDEKVKELSGNVVADIVALSGNVLDEISDITQESSELSDKIDTLSGAVESMSADMKTYIDTELTTVYTYKESVADYAALGAIQNPEIGDVYNVVAAHGNPGDADYTPAGTNYAWNGSAWDALGGTVDLSNYATTGNLSTLSGQVATNESNISTLRTDVNTVSGKVIELSGKVVSDYITSANAESAIETAEANAKHASSAYTDAQIQMLSGITSAYVANQLTEVNNDITALKDFRDQSAATHTEVAAASAATFNSAYTNAYNNAIYASSAYTDAEITELIGDMAGDTKTLGELQDEIEAASAAADTRLTAAEQNITNLNNSAATWNTLVSGSIKDGKLGTLPAVAELSESGTTQSGAKMDVVDQTIKLDLSTLVIDCGDF